MSNIARRFGIIEAASPNPVVTGTNNPLRDLEGQVKLLQAQVALLEADVAALRANGNAAAPVTRKIRNGNAMTAAEKQRAYRARLKAGKKESTDA